MTNGVITQEDFPDVWSCSSPQKRVQVEVRVRGDVGGGFESLPGENLYSWIELPTTNVEQWTEKGDAAQIQRTAKVVVPNQWGRDTADVRHNSPRQFLDQFEPTDSSPFMMARVWFQDRDGSWILKHFGWVGGIGPESATTSKFWIYDMAEMLSGVPVGVTFNDPSIRQALEDIGNETRDRTPIPLTGLRLVPPDSEEEYLRLIADDMDLFGAEDPVFAEPDLADDIRELDGESAASEYYSLTDTDFTGVDLGYSEEDITEETTAAAEDAFAASTIGTDGIDIGNLDAKTFQTNHDTLLDVYEWFERKSNAKLHFQPRPNGVVLVADVVPERRIFAHDDVLQHKLDVGDTDYQYHHPVKVIDNQALYEMKPMNTLRLRGSTAEGLLDPARDFIDAAGGVFGYEPPAEEYPVVEVQVPALVEAAEGVTLSPEVVESDASTLDSATREAKRELRDILEETTEGDIVLGGAPRVMPYDAVDAFEVCNDRVTYEQEPVRYEVESVKHVKSSDDVFKTVVEVSVWANDSNMEVTEQRMVETAGRDPAETAPTDLDLDI